MYKYLGVELDYKLSFIDFKLRILNRARCNLGRIWSMGLRNGSLSVKGSINVYNALVRSILEYASEIWGVEKWCSGEQVQLEMGRRILRCSSRTSREAILGDLGFCHLQSRRNLKKLQYWRKITSLPDSSLVKHVYLVSKQSNKKGSWANEIKRILEKYNMVDVWNNNNLLLNVNRQWFSRQILAQEEKEWWNKMQTKSKLRTYIKVKSKLRLERAIILDAHYILPCVMVATSLK